MPSIDPKKFTALVAAAVASVFGAVATTHADPVSGDPAGGKVRVGDQTKIQHSGGQVQVGDQTKIQHSGGQVQVGDQTKIQHSGGQVQVGDQTKIQHSGH